MIKESKTEERKENRKPDYYGNSEIEINTSLKPFQRTLAYVSKVQNPYSFHMEGYDVELEWIDTDITLQDKIKDIFTF